MFQKYLVYVTPPDGPSYLCAFTLNTDGMQERFNSVPAFLSPRGFDFCFVFLLISSPPLPSEEFFPQGQTRFLISHNAGLSMMDG